MSLRCEATGNGTLNYQWIKVSGLLPKSARIKEKGKKLNIRNIALNDSGQYYCNVSNDEGSVSSMKVQVTVKS